MANVGLPGTSGFVGEFLTLLGAYRANTWVAFFASTGVILSAAYALWLYRKVVFGALEKPSLKGILDLSMRERLILYPLVAVTVFYGVYPSPILHATAASVEALVTKYQAAIQTLHQVAQEPSSVAMIPNFAPALPEIVLAVAAMALLMIGVFRGERSVGLVTGLALLAVIVVLGMLVLAPHYGATFGGAFVVDPFARFMKIIALIGSGLAIVMSHSSSTRDGWGKFEYPVLILLATLGMMMMISASDLISLYVGLELQSLALYVVASIDRDNLKSTEAGLKYFVLGALSSGMLLYGMSLAYGFTGHTDFAGIADALKANGVSLGVTFAIVFILAGLAFKVSAVPFHMWTPDVYEGAPTAVTAFFAAAPKVAAMALIVRVVSGPFAPAVHDWRQILVFVSIASMLLGAFAAIGQRNIKRLMAYSSIGHMGYALVGLAAGSEEGVTGVAIYMAVYLVMTVGGFA
eukprot:gene25034-27039_t